MLKVDPRACTPADLAPAVEWLAQGGIVAFPTDTQYGLAVDPASPQAVSALFALKGRPADSAVPFVAASIEQVQRWCGLSGATARVAAEFWPGPLSVICDAPATVVPAALAGGDTVAIRVPAHPVARALAGAWGSPITATSANRSGEPAATRVADLIALHSPHLLVIDGGDAAGGAASTIVDARRDPPALIRAGAIAWERVLHSLQR